jgi:hypothetical protein
LQPEKATRAAQLAAARKAGDTNNMESDGFKIYRVSFSRSGNGRRAKLVRFGARLCEPQHFGTYASLELSGILLICHACCGSQSRAPSKMRIADCKRLKDESAWEQFTDWQVLMQTWSALPAIFLDRAGELGGHLFTKPLLQTPRSP